MSSVFSVAAISSSRRPSAASFSAAPTTAPPPSPLPNGFALDADRGRITSLFPVPLRIPVYRASARGSLAPTHTLSPVGQDKVAGHRDLGAAVRDVASAPTRMDLARVEA